MKPTPEICRLPLHAIAHSRAGDKGNISNVSLIAYKREAYPFLSSQVTSKKVHGIYSHLGASHVVRYELPQLSALNFVIYDVLDGGVNASRSLDRHGKTLSYLLLSRFIIDIPLEFLPQNSPYLDPNFIWDIS